jgi:aryl-alcohol dehydrogenase-like predicted oxidoreductase
MEYRPLGRSGLRVSLHALGTMTFGGVSFFAKTGSADAKDAKRLVDIAIDHGVNLLDTANMYSYGRSEEIIGEITEGRSSQLLIASKVRMVHGKGPNEGGLSRFHIIEECEKSLKRLRRDHLDLYFLHEWDGETPIEEIMSALDQLIKSGKVRYIGCSNFSGWHIMKALNAAERHGFERFVCQQIHYTLEAREAEYELVPIAIDQGVGIMVWSPLAGGLLSGKFRRGAKGPADSRHLQNWGEPPIRDENRLHDIIEELVAIAEARGVSAAQIALAWLAGRPGVSSLVVGARTEAQLKDNLAAVSFTLTAEERARLDKVSQLPLLYPYWHQLNTANDRLSPADLALLGPHLANAKPRA